MVADDLRAILAVVGMAVCLSKSARSAGKEDAMPTPPARRQRRAGGLPDALGRADLAAEFLRRNSTYRTEHAQMWQRIASGAVAQSAAETAFARRWGLSFRHGAG